MIFLLVAEDRGLLHPPEASPAARTLYGEGYGLSRLRDRAIRRSAWDAHDDLWDGLLIVFEALGTRGEPALGLPALDGLFARGGLGELEASALPNKALMAAIYRLAWLKDEGALVPVNWRDMETEELGSVYESLLELTPRLAEDGRGYGFAEGAETKGNQRKTTGSYYTPDSLVQVLLDSALDPVLERVEREAGDPGEALLGVTAIDPACGSGHFLLAAARRIATRVARARAGGTASAADYRHALRDVARRCIHGVDRNPMAVELTKVALWIETVEPGKPLGFLDANIRCGDALLGVFDLDALAKGVPDAAYKPLVGDDKAAARVLLVRNRAEREGQGALDFTGGGGQLPPVAPLARAERDWRALPEDSPAEIAARRARFEAARADPRAWSLRVACDLYVAAFLAPKPAGAAATPSTTTVTTTGDVWRRMTGGQVYGPREGKAVDLAREARAFHWPLEFPDVVAAGGFDVVLGNPPWERIKLQEQEFFAPREPEIAAAPNAAARGRMIAALAAAGPGSRERALFESFEQAKRTAEAASVFARVPGQEGGRFALTGRGDVNTYALFAELFANLAGPRGRAGVIVPTSIVTADTLKEFFSALINERRLISSFNFFEVRQWFPATDDRSAFGLFTLGVSHTDAEFAFSLLDVNDLNQSERRFTLSSAQISKLNPNTKTACVFRSKEDARLTERIYDRVPVLLYEVDVHHGNPWGISFLAMFHMANDSRLFRLMSETSINKEYISKTGFPDYIDENALWRAPLIEARMIHLYDHRWATYDGEDIRDTTTLEKSDENYEVTARYWVAFEEVARRLATKGRRFDWLMGWRDITNLVNERSLIAATLPMQATNHKIPLFFTAEEPRKSAALLANLNSIVVDYILRQKLAGASLTYFYLKQLPVLPPSAYSPSSLAFIVPRVLELTYTSWNLKPFARDLGHEGPPFPWDEDRRAILRAELDAWYADAYGLTRDELRYVLDPADVMGAHYPSETFRVLKTNELRRYGEYRTQRLVLAAWDEQQAAHQAPIIVHAPATVSDLNQLPDRAWERPVAAVSVADQTAVQLAALARLLTRPIPAERARLAAVYALQPRLLTPYLDGARRDTWLRLVGPDAQPLSPGMVAVSNLPGWRSALAQLVSGQVLVDDVRNETWSAGSGINIYGTSAWNEGRAAFALQEAERILSAATTQLSIEEQTGVRALAAA